MQDTYFDHILSRYKGKSIALVSSVFPTKDKLQEAAREEFNGCRNIITDCRLIDAAMLFLKNSDLGDTRSLSVDTKIVFDRCWDRFQQMRESIRAREAVNYDFLFDTMVDCCWLASSMQYSREKNSGRINLLDDPNQIRVFLRLFLKSLHNFAISEMNEWTRISEAMKPKWQIFMGLCPDPEVQKYLSRDLSHSDLERMLEERKDNSMNKMALFYGLTATSALAENIRRQLL